MLHPNGIATKTKPPKKKGFGGLRLSCWKFWCFFTNRNPHLGSEVTHLRPSAAYCHEVSMHVRGNSSWKRRDLAIFENCQRRTSWWLVVQVAATVDENTKDDVGHHRCLHAFQVSSGSIKGRNSHCDSMSTLRSIPNSADYRPSSCRSEKFTAVSPASSIVWDQATCFGFPPPQTCETQIGGNTATPNEKPWAESFAPQAHFRPKP